MNFEDVGGESGRRGSRSGLSICMELRSNVHLEGEAATHGAHLFIQTGFLASGEAQSELT
jgi:hypothetical protein